MLEPILGDATARADEARSQAEHLRMLAASAPEPRGFVRALGDRSLIAEIKRRSPSRGPLAPGLDAAAQSKRYESGGAAAISVLTEPYHFDGALDDLIAVVQAVEVPVLRKDFLLDPAQVWESRAAGADAVLLIVAVLADDRLTLMIEAAAEAGLDALVEVHDEAETERALGAGATLLGVNNRDLTTFDTDLSVAARLAPMLERTGLVTVAESGVSNPAAARQMWELGYDALLVGEALVTASEPERLITELRGP